MQLGKKRVCRFITIAAMLLLGAAGTVTMAAPQVNITQIDASNFDKGFIYLVAEVNENGNPVGDLTAADFTVSEDGRNQTDYFNVTPPDQSGGVRLVDFVFLITDTYKKSVPQLL